VLAANYIAPDPFIETRLILFTPDGKVNDPSAGFALLSGMAFDDDENMTTGSAAIFCYANLSLEDIFGPFVRRDVSHHIVGHFELRPGVATAQFDANETDPLTGDANSSRRRPVHGWIVHFMAPGGQIGGPPSPTGPYPTAGPPMVDMAAWASTLVQGTSPLAPLGADVPALHAGPPPF
jgi:hypothetical protein